MNNNTWWLLRVYADETESKPSAWWTDLEKDQMDLGSFLDSIVRTVAESL